jgi:hypothetical protein
VECVTDERLHPGRCAPDFKIYSYSSDGLYLVLGTSMVPWDAGQGRLLGRVLGLGETDCCVHLVSATMEQYSVFCVRQIMAAAGGGGLDF